MSQMLSELVIITTCWATHCWLQLHCSDDNVNNERVNDSPIALWL